MLTAIRVHDFRCFHDSGPISLSDLNVFVGPNNAGKSTLMSAISLLLASSSADDARTPLKIDRDPVFASFDSVLRKHWSAQASRPSHFSFSGEYRLEKLFSGQSYWADYKFSKTTNDGRTYVDSIEYGLVNPEKRHVEVKISQKDGRYRISSPDELSDRPVFFFGQLPALLGRKDVKSPEKFRDWLALSHLTEAYSTSEAIVVRPYRPVPRSVYVVDDPNMSFEDRKLISDLLRIWSSSGGNESRDRIAANLRTMSLAKSISVKSKAKAGPSIVEIRIAAANSRHEVTINDVGYGVSQILPLLVAESQARGQSIVAYQPEAHLHPYAQSRLADFFVGAIKNDNRCFVETHSEHLILRLQTLIAEGQVPPEKVRVFCVERQGNESKIRTMQFHADGRPIDPWPSGFLDTGLALARQLSFARTRRTA
jgi:AAA15 family ATPase/GTPase